MKFNNSITPYAEKVIDHAQKGNESAAIAREAHARINALENLLKVWRGILAIAILQFLSGSLLLFALS